MTLRATNLNLLPILQALLQHANITRAAEHLGLSQPATSNALRRLRDMLGDPLLVQIGRSMKLTPYAQRLRPAIDGICGSIETMLTDRDFVAAEAKGDFVVATPDYMALLLGRALIPELARSAPGISVRFTDVGPDFRRLLASGEIDFAIVADIDDLARGFSVRRGYTDRLVGVVACDHPLASTPPKSMTELLAYPQLGVDPRLQGMTTPNLIADMMGTGRGQLQVTASHLLVLPLLVADTGGIAVVPEALARQAVNMVAISEFDLPGPTIPLNLCTMWSPLLDAEPAHCWFREQLDLAMSTHFVTHQSV